MNGVWIKFGLMQSPTFHGFQPEEVVSNSSCAITDMGRSVRFEEVNEANVKELL
jgi:hypothetical protein